MAEQEKLSVRQTRKSRHKKGRFIKSALFCYPTEGQAVCLRLELAQRVGQFKSKQSRYSCACGATEELILSITQYL